MTVSDPLGIPFTIGLVGAAVWYGYRAVTVRKAYHSASESDASIASAVAGTEVTIDGEVIVDEPVPTAGDDALVGSAPRPAVVVWRLRRGTRSRFDGMTGGGADWTTVESGIDAGTFEIDTDHGAVRVDPTWIFKRHSDAELRSVSPSDLAGSGLRAKEAWKTPYVHLHSCNEAFELSEKSVLAPDIHAQVEDDRKIYELQVKVLPDGASCAVHGQLEIDQGTPVVRGTDEIPLTLSDRGPAALRSNLHHQIVKNAGYAIVLLVFAAAVCYATVKTV